MPEKPKRKIFQPDYLTNLLLESHLSQGGNLNDTINEAILDFFTPKLSAFKKAFEFLCLAIQEDRKLKDDEMKGLISNCIRALSNHPIKDCSILEKIFFHFNAYSTLFGNSKHSYEYILFVDDESDKKLQHLNEILFTVDDYYNNLWSRELGPRTIRIFENWEQLFLYPEIYEDLSLIINFEREYRPINQQRMLYYIMELDNLACQSNFLPCKEPFPTNITPVQKYFAIKNSIIMYYTDNAYFFLSKDYNFEHMPNEIREYYREIEKEPYRRTSDRFFEPTEEDMEYIISLEKKGKRLFRQLAAKSNFLQENFNSFLQLQNSNLD